MSIHGLILAAGEGSRMKQLTNRLEAKFALPKHLLTVCGMPLCVSGLNVLKRAGIEDNTITISHLQKRIRSYFGKKLKYFNSIYGPGGDVGSFAGKHLKADDILVVMSGEYFHNFDLQDMLNKVKDAVVRDATVALTLNSTKAEDKFRKIESEMALNNIRRAGCYVFPGSTLFKLAGFTENSLSDKLLKEIIRRNSPLYSAALPEGQYAFEADTLYELWQANMDAVGGKTGIDFKKENYGDIYPGVGISPPVWIGDGVKIGKSSTIGPYAVIGPGYTIGNYTRVTGSVLLSTASLCGGKEIGEIPDKTSVLMSIVASSRVPEKTRMEFQLGYSDPQKNFSLKPLDFDKDFCYRRIAETPKG